MKWFLRTWYYFGLIPAGIALIALILNWQNLTVSKG